MILDELDSGVGARLGKSVGRILRKMAAAQLKAQQPGTHHVSLQSELSKQHQLGAQQPHVQPELSPQPERRDQGPHGTISQILCVSHLPQVGSVKSLCLSVMFVQFCILCSTVVPHIGKHALRPYTTALGVYVVLCSNTGVLSLARVL